MNKARANSGTNFQHFSLICSNYFQNDVIVTSFSGCNPAAAIYVLFMVLIFSILWNLGSAKTWNIQENNFFIVNNNEQHLKTNLNMYFMVLVKWNNRRDLYQKLMNTN